MTGPQPISSDVPGDNTSGTFVSEGAPGSAQPTASAQPAAEAVPAQRGTNDLTGDALARVAEPELPAAERRNVIVQLAASLRRKGFTEMFKPRVALAWITDTLVDVAPRIPLRNLGTLRDQHPGLSDEQIADRVVAQAVKTTTAIGAIGGGVTSVEWVAAPTLLTAPALLAAETLAVVAVEIKMLGELQELYGQPVPGGPAQRATGLLQAWSGRRGVDLLVPGGAISVVLSTAARKQLRDRLIRRFGRNLTTLGPLFTGAAVGAYLNRRATRHLAEHVRRDLGRRQGAITS